MCRRLSLRSRIIIVVLERPTNPRPKREHVGVPMVPPPEIPPSVELHNKSIILEVVLFSELSLGVNVYALIDFSRTPRTVVNTAAAAPNNNKILALSLLLCEVVLAKGVLNTSCTCYMVCLLPCVGPMDVLEKGQITCHVRVAPACI